MNTTSTADVSLSHKEQMLKDLNDADFWHDIKANKTVNKKKKLMHRRYQVAIWWAIQNLDNQSVLPALNPRHGLLTA